MNLSRKILGHDAEEGERYDLESGLPYSYMYVEDGRNHWNAGVFLTSGCISMSLETGRTFYRSLEQNTRDLGVIAMNFMEQNGAKMVEITLKDGRANEVFDQIKKYRPSTCILDYQMNGSDTIRILKD